MGEIEGSRYQSAYHEAGHATVAYVQKRILIEIGVCVKEDELGKRWTGYCRDTHAGSGECILANTMTSTGADLFEAYRGVAGAVAEAEAIDSEQEVAKLMSTFDECVFQEGFERLAGLDAGDRAKAALARWCEEAVGAILRRNHHVLDALAGALMEQDELTGDEARAVIAQAEAAANAQRPGAETEEASQ